MAASVCAARNEWFTVGGDAAGKHLSGRSMGITLLERLFRRQAPAVSEEALPEPAREPALAPSVAWPPPRLALAERLWGEGFLWPGGADEIRRMTAPFGLSAAHSLLLLGVGAGGPARTIAADLGVWVSGFEADPGLAEIAARRLQRAGAALAKRATVAAWRPEAPQFPPRGFHHALLLDVLPENAVAVVLPAAVQAVKPGGQIMIAQSITDARHGEAIIRGLADLGADVRVVEDESALHARLALQGWKLLVRQLRASKPTPAEAATVVSEAAAWLHRLRRIREGRLRVMRWGAIVT
jgi:hypothetical protein